MNQAYTFFGCCGAFQICGSAVSPTLNVTSIPAKLKSKGYSNANGASILFCSIPYSLIYGFINDKWKVVDTKLCVKYFTIYSFIGILWLLILLFLLES